MTAAKTIVQTWLARCKAEPGQTALRHKRRGIWRSITWQEYHDAVLHIALAIERAGVDSGSVVSIVSESRPEYLYADLAAQALGCVSHGVYPTCSSRRVGEQLQLAGADIVFVENAEQAEKVLEAQSQLSSLRVIVVFDARGLRELNSDRVVGLAAFMGTQAIGEKDLQHFEDRIGSTRTDDVAFLFGTAGSTGVPRLAAVTHEVALRRVRSMQTAFETRAGDRTLCFVPLANAAERMFSAVLPLLENLEVDFPESPATVMNDLREVQPDWVHAPPRFWEKLLARTESVAMLASSLARHMYQRSFDAQRSDWIAQLSRRHLRRSMGLARARVGYCGGAAVSPALHRWFNAIGLPLLDIYESAETCGPAMRLPMTGFSGDAELETEVRVGVENELELRSTAQFSGYWNGKQLIPVSHTEDGWLTTGDAVHVTDEGLSVVGRVSNRFPTHDGRTMLPEIIERELHATPYIAHAVVLGEERGRCSCLLALEMDSVLSYAQTQAIPFVDFAHLVGNEAIQSLLHRQIEGVNDRMEEGVRIERFSVLPSPSPGDEGMTPTLRMQRAMVVKAYEAVAAVPNKQDATWSSRPQERSLNEGSSGSAA